MTGDNQLIDEAEGLVNFRLKESAEVILQHSLEHQNVVVNWQVGVGKSYNMDQVIEAAIRQGHYDLVIVMAPNLLGLSAVLRPIVVAPEGYGIGEVDLAQIEVAITAAVYNDKDLIKKYNAGDLYTALAQEFY